MLYSIFRDISTTIAQLELVSSEQEQLLLEKNARVPEPLNKTVHQLVGDRITKQPTAIAVEAWDGSLTYAELDRQASRLAQLLVSKGVAPEIPVGICMDKSRSVPIAMLAILRAGGAVMPIGIAEPIARVEVILSDSSPIAVICDAKQMERLSDLGLGTTFLSIDDIIGDEISTRTTEGVQPKPQNIAWIFYTSGSTGKPKGVLVEHNSLATSMHAHGAALEVSSESRVLQFSAHTFDVSLHDLFTTLIYGGCICIPNEQERLNDLPGSIRRLQVNMLPLTPSVASTIKPEDVPLVKKLVMFGEEVKASVLESWLGKAAIFNAYGPTESSIFASVSKPFQTMQDLTNIGFPMNLNFWVTDPQNPGRLCPPGAPGELLIEGPLLARGYLNDEAKTAVAFIQEPEFSSRLLGSGNGRRFYRTGDIVRQNKDFSMSYIGRRDTQIKVRGQRLDVAEVEHWITKLLDGVFRAVVGVLTATDEDAASVGGAFLFAAVEFSGINDVPSDGNDYILPTSEELRARLGGLRNTLQAKLPSYMIPTFFVPFRQIPLTASTKTDRNMVRRLISELSTADLQSYVSEESSDEGGTLTATAQTLRTLWAAILGVSSTSIRANDHFLYRGGDSLSAIKLVEAARLKDVHLTVADVLGYPRLEDIAGLLDERAAATNQGSAQRGVSSSPRAFSLWQPSSIDKEEELAEIANQCAMSPADIEDIYPCTPLQQTMLAATQQRPSAYIVRQVFALSESIDIKRFRQSWQVMMDKSPLMRTRILLGQRSGSLQVLSKTAPAWQVHDSLNAYVEEDKANAMAVGQPLMRFALVQESSSGARYFVWTAHHSAYDGWSAKLIYSRLAALYLHDEIPPAVPFTRFIEYLQSDSLRSDEAAAYWRRQLDGETPTAFPSLPSSFYQAKPHSNLHSEISTSVTTSSRPASSLANVLRAAWAMTLSQYLGTRDVVFGVTLSGRNAPVAEITELIAPTITTVPVRVQVDQDVQVASYLENIQSQAVEMIPFEHTGLQDVRRLVPDLQPATDVKHVFVIEPPTTGKGGEADQFPGLHVVDTALDAFDTFALTLQCSLPSNRGGLVNVEARFDNNVVPESEMAVLLRQFDHWVSLFLEEANSDKPLNTLEEVTATDLAQIRTQNAETPVRDVACLHHLVQSIGREQPNAPAVCSWDGDFTYYELETYARKLAHHLSNHGVGPHVRVGVCMDKSKWTVVAMLGILEAGGVVVLLGAQLPVARLRALVNDCEARVVLTNAGSTKRLGESAFPVMAVDEALLTSIPAPLFDGPICPALKPHHPAWIVYTSGSTGMPKGSLLIHGGLATSLPAHGRATRWNRQSRTLQFSAHMFDVTIQEIMTTLIFGGCVCIPSEDQRINALSQTITDMNVNQLVMTFTVASMINPKDVPSVRQLQVAGEQAKPSVVETWLGNVELINIYGPSECSVYSSCATPMQRVEDAPVIGYPLDQCNFWVTSTTDHNRLCPIGIPGELLIENAWQAQEYINNPELTAQSFVVEPEFIKQLGLGGTGRRMYRTGDLVRQNPNGSYTYMGRIGSQVKFRGHRVELSEIEYWIGKLLKGVQKIVVDTVDLTAGKGAGDLVAVVDFDENSEFFTSGQIEEIDEVKILAPSTTLQKALCGLKDALAEKLPSFMVPTAYLPWQKIPLNPSGKTNRGAVRQFLTNLKSGPSLLQRYLADDGTKEGPATQMGKRVQQLWADILSIDADSIGGRDHFTRLGGDSLAAMKLVVAGRRAGLHLTVASIFTHPILNDFAEVIEKEQRAGTMAETEDDPVPFELGFETASGPDLETRVADVATQCKVHPEQIEDVYPCTPMQEALFAITARQPTTYTYRQVFQASQRIDMEKFRAAWEAVVRALPILRTRIILDHNSGFLQVVINESIAWYSGENLDDYLETDKAIGFQPGRPLMRCGLVGDQSSNARYFVLTTHHSIFDKWSLQRVYNKYLYPAYMGLEMPAVVPFPRFIRYVLRSDQEAASQYWNRTLSDGDAFTDFPSLPTNNQYQSKPNSTLKVTVGVNEFAELRIPFPSVLRAAWGLTVAQYAAVNDVMFAVNLSGRSAPVAEITEMAAPAFTTVPVRIKVDNGQKVRDYLDHVHNEGVEMIPYEHTGLQKIKKLVPTFDPTNLRHLFLVYPAVDADATDPTLHVSGFEQAQMRLDAQDDYPLTILCKVDERGVEAGVEARYDSTVINEDRLESLLRQFEHNVALLGDVVLEEQTVGGLPLANTEDVEQVVEWNQSVQKTPLDCVHEPFIKMAQESPETQAVCSWDGAFTYRQLDQMARILAHKLVTDGGVGPERAVGLCMDKSRWAVACMLAILYAGGAIVPLGVQLPKERLSVMIKDCSPALIICDETHADKFKDMGCKSMVVNELAVDQIQQTHNGHHESVPSPSVKPDSMAWIMYTSGSTGTPKGVVLEHRGLRSSLIGKGDGSGADSTCRVYQFSAFTFDISISDIFVTLSRGGTVCMPSESERMNDLVGSIQRMNVNYLNLVASTAALVPPTEVPAVRTIIVGGEYISPALIEKWLLHSNARVVNSYGPAECSINSTMNSNITDKNNSSVIGKALPGTRTWVVDPNDHNRLAPIGAVGELLIEGPNVGRGYLNDLQKTATAFITDPAFVDQIGSTQEGRRMYRTGDLVRYEEDGNLRLLGRRDTQVKIRGQRVHLGEIETSIVKLLPEVKTAVVEYLSPTDAQHVLVAALEFVDRDRSSLSNVAESLKTSLAERLPKYMVPRVYLQMDVVPNTASGKTDRRAVQRFMLTEGLSHMDRLSPASSKPGMVQGDKEAIVRKLWASILGMKEESIDRLDNFFDLGGDSIGAMKLVATAKMEGLLLEVVDIFESQVLKDLAAVVRTFNGSVLSSTGQQAYRPFQLLGHVDDIGSFLDEVVCPVTGTEKESIQDAFPATDSVSFSVVGALTASQTEVNTFVFDTDSGLDLDRLQQSCILLAQHVEAFRTAFVLDIGSGNLLQVIFESYLHNAPLIRVGASLDSATKDLLEGEMGRPFRLGRPMAAMAVLHQETTGKTRIVLRMSHAIYDGLSLPIIRDTLCKLYNQGALESPLSSFSAYVHELRTHTNDKVYSYWRDLLDGSTMPELSKVSKSNRQSTWSMEFTDKKTIPVSRSKGGGITISTIVNCAWAHVLAQYTGRNDVVFGETISGRNLVDSAISNNLVGCCASHVPLRVKLGDPGDHSILELLHQVKEQQRSRIPHEGLGFRSIIRDCTDWIPSTRFTSIVNHRPDVAKAASDSDSMGFQISTFTSETNTLNSFYDLAVISGEDDGLIRLSLGYSTTAFEPEMAQALLEDLANTVQVCMSAVASKSDMSALHGTQMMPSASSRLAKSRPVANGPHSDGLDIISSNGMTTDIPADNISPTIDKLWFTIFDSRCGRSGPAATNDSSLQQRHMPFYDLGGDLLNVAHFTAQIEQHKTVARKSQNKNDPLLSSIIRTEKTMIDYVLTYPSLEEFDDFYLKYRIE